MKMIIRTLCLLVIMLSITRVHAQLLDPDQAVKPIPELNQRIVAYAMDHRGKKVGRGECWDLAADALNSGGASWDGEYGFGEIVDWRKDEILPGDIVQFANVEVERRIGNSIMREHYPKHTAVIVQVVGKGIFTIAHQNVEPIGKKVATSELRMRDVRGGTLTFYRPHLDR